MAKDKRSKQLQEMEESGQKFSKKSTFKNVFSKALEIGLLGVLAALVIPEGIGAIKGYTGPYKSNAQITEDAQYFDANMEIANIMGSNTLFSTTYKRMKHNGDKPIYVTISSNFSDSEKQMIEQIIDYYEQLFTSINSKYRFEVVDKEKAIFEKLIGNTVINFDESSTLPDTSLGVNMLRANIMNSNFLKTSRIFTNETMSDVNLKYYVYMHEFAHSFGLGDVYEKFTPVMHSDTFLNMTPFSVGMAMLYPNDVAMLYAMYGESYRDGDEILPEKLAECQEALNDYKEKFFNKASQILCENYSMTEKELRAIDVQTLENKQLWYTHYLYNSTTRGGKEYDYSIDFLDDKTASYKIYNQGELLSSFETLYINQNGMVFFPALHLPNGYAPGDPYYGKEAIQMLTIYNKNGQIFAVDMEDYIRATVHVTTMQATSQKTSIESKIFEALKEEMNKPDEVQVSVNIDFLP